MSTREILENKKNIAVYGMSTNPRKEAHTVPVFMAGQDYNIYPINPVADEIAGYKSYKKLKDIPETIQILNVFRPSEDCLDVVKEAVERKKEKGDIDVVWLQLGIRNDKAKELAEENGMAFIQDTCILVEYKKNMM